MRLSNLGPQAIFPIHWDSSFEGVRVRRGPVKRGSS